MTFILETKVVNIRNTAKWDAYIGRHSSSRNLEESLFHNPFKIGLDGSRDDVLIKYERYMRSKITLQPWMKEQLLALNGLTLACWCKPLDCHGDILIKLLKEILDVEKETTDSD